MRIGRIVPVLVLVLAVACNSKSKPKNEPAGGSGSGTGSTAGSGSGQSNLKTSVDVASIADATGLDRVTGDDGMVIVVSPTDVAVEGKSIVALRDGSVDPADKEGGAAGLKIPALANYVDAVVKEQNAKAAANGTAAGDPAALFVVDKNLRFELVYQLLFTVTRAGVKRVAFLLKAGNDLVLLPITLPDRAKPVEPTAGSGGSAATPGPLMPVVALAGDRASLWSMSGREGTIDKPKASVTYDAAGYADLAKAATDVVTRTWPAGSTRTDDERQIVVMASAATPLQRCVDVVAAVRTGFPSIVLSAGIE
jgi:biopolymer transport protein ExbD